VAATLLALESAFLVASGVSFWSESSGFFSPTPAVAALQRTVGGQLVGLGKCDPSSFALPALVDLGISPDANIGYGIHEFTVYDPLVRRAYARSWYAASGQRVPAARFSFYGIFCPAVATVSEARIFGVRYVLEPSGSDGPDGTRFVSDIGDEQLFAVPGAAAATLVTPDSSSGGSDPPLDAPGSPVTVSYPGTSSWRLHVDTASPALLRLRLTAVPGWHATIDGRPLPLRTWADGAMLEARVPPGSHRVDVEYRPGLFTTGLVLAAVAVIVMVIMAVLGAVAALRRRQSA